MSDDSMDSYVAAREVAMPSAPSTPAPAAPSPAQEPASSGNADALPASPAAPSPAEPGAAPVALTPEQREARAARNRTQERFDSLTRRALDAERREAMLLEAHRAVVAREQPQPAKPAAPIDAPPREEDYPGDYRAFLRADMQYVARKETEAANQRADDARTQQQNEREQAARQQQQIRQVGEVLTQFDSRKDAYAAQAPDYDTAIESLEAIPIGEHNAEMVKTLLLRPDSAKVLHYLGKNPQVAQQISQLPPALQGAAVGEFAAYCNRAVQPSAAPPPGRPVGTRAPSTGASPPSGSMDDYASWRERQSA